MSTKYVECRYETGATPGKESGVSSSFATKTIYVPAQEFSFNPNLAVLRRDDEMRGLHEPLAFVPEEFRPSWSMRFRMYPDAFAFFVKALYGAPVTTAGDGIITDLDAVAIPAGATRHTWTAPYGATGNPTTIMFRVGLSDESLFYEVRGATVQSLEIATPDTGGVMVTVSGLANFVDDFADPSLTPTFESLAIEPFLKTFAGLTWVSGSAFTETISWSLTQGKDHTRTFGGASEYPDLIEFSEGVPEISFSIDKRAIDVDDWNALIAGTRFTALSKWIHSDFITGAYPFKSFIQGPSTSAAYAGGGEVSVQNRRRTPAAFTGLLSRDSAASSVIQVVNSVAAYT